MNKVMFDRAMMHINLMTNDDIRMMLKTCGIDSERKIIRSRNQREGWYGGRYDSCWFPGLGRKHYRTTIKNLSLRHYESPLKTYTNQF